MQYTRQHEGIGRVAQREATQSYRRWAGLCVAVLTLLALVRGGLPGLAFAWSYNHIVVFGDSISDSGNVLKRDFALALEARAEARAIGETIQDPSLQSYAAWIFGWVHATRGDWDVGIATCQQGLAGSPAPLNTLFALCALGHAYLEQGDTAQAIPVLQQATEQTQRFRHRPLQTWMTTLLAEAYRAQGDLEQARALALQALDIAQAINNAWGLGLAQHALGRLARATGATAAEETYLTEALATFVSMPAQFKVGQVHLDLAILAHTQGNMAAITTHLREAQTLFTALHVPTYVERTAQLASALSVSLAVEKAARPRGHTAGFYSGLPLARRVRSALPARVALRWRAWPRGTCSTAPAACGEKSALNFLYART